MKIGNATHPPAATRNSGDVPVAGNELQRPHRHLLFLRRFPGARQLRPTFVPTAGDHFFEGAGVAMFIDARGFLPLAGGGTGAPLPDPFDQRRRAYPQSDAGNSGARKRIRSCADCGAATGSSPTTATWWIFSPVLDGGFLPVGNTDNERAFCWLLQTRQRFGDLPDKARCSTRFELAADLAHGEFNFLLATREFLPRMPRRNSPASCGGHRSRRPI